MGHWDEVRQRAREKRAEILAQAAETAAAANRALPQVVSAAEILRIAGEVTGVERYATEADDSLLYGAQAILYFDGPESAIYYNDTVDTWYALFCQAHEFGHLWLHYSSGVPTGPGCGAEDVDMDASDADLPMGAQSVQGYGPRERREREANVFAREFLLPADAVRDWFNSGLSAQQIAYQAQMPKSLVYQQLAYALLTPVLDIDETAQPQEQGAAPQEVGTAELDPSQRAAAHIEHGPVLIEAGPGTGKTRTLTARVAHLLDSGVPPEAILTLTFSNKAAEEMRTRVAAVAPAAAPLIWMGTFHSFGLELLSKHGTHIGLPNKVGIIDPVDAVLALERSLSELRLVHYMNLYEPTTHLRDILSAISRAKDELVGPDRYTELAREMAAQAQTPEEVVRAEEAHEVARVYHLYQNYLQREGLVDFGDLIASAVKLLREHPDVGAQVRAAYKHILVDEFQDVNRASGLLLREIAGSGEGLWAVGDARQAIYRFRGASPRNMRDFARDYPGARMLQLGVNYRSRSRIVATFAHMAPNMRATKGAPFTPWEAKRGSGAGSSQVMMEIADDPGAEADAIAARIGERRAEGVAYKDQAVLCRSHTTLARIGAALEKRGIPVLYLGDLFEREEVRDMLALIELSRDTPESIVALVRVGGFAEYAVPDKDIRTLLKLAREQEWTSLQAVDEGSRADEISEQGQAGLALLAAHLEEARGDTPWKMLAPFLFGASGYLRSMSSGSIAHSQMRLALFQFLQFAQEQHRACRDARIANMGVELEEDPKKHFLDYVRTLEIFGEERALRQVPEWSQSIDAVRLLTIHASKGLEFSAVYIPSLTNRHFPTANRKPHCPPPIGMLGEEDADWHEEEEECLFFVALSRARDSLCLLRSKRSGKLNSGPSRLLSLIAEALPAPPDGPSAWQGEPPALEAAPPEPAVKTRFLLGMLEVYRRCPRQFFYEYELTLGGDPEEAAYVRFHRAVYETIGEMRAAEEAGEGVGTEQALELLEDRWQEAGMEGHVHEPIYHEQARNMVARAVERAASKQRRWVKPKWEVTLAYGRVSFVPDQAEVLTEDGETQVRLQRLRTGRASDKEEDNPIYGLYYAAARRAYPEASHRVQALYLATNETVDINRTAKQIDTALEKYNKALAGILTRDFHPEPSDRQCPRCAYYFICPSGEVK